MKIKKFKNNFSVSDIFKLSKVILKGEHSIGENIEIFEKKISEIVKLENVCCVSNGFSSIFISLRALEINIGDRVILPVASSCHSIRNAVLATGAKPYYIDLKPNMPVSDYSNLKNLPPNTKAIISINHFGFLDEVYKFQIGIPVIEDSAHSFGLENDFEDKVCSITSFYPTKIINSIDGGAIYSKSKDFIEKCKDLRSYDYKFDQKLRYNFKLSNINATLGNIQLAKYYYLIKRRKMISKKFFEAIKNSEIVDLSIYDNVKIFYKFPILFKKNIDLSIIKKTTDKLKIPILKALIFNDSNTKNFKNANSIVNRLYLIPCYPELNKKEIKFIYNELKNIF